jgi:hypothetical protein
MRQHHENRADVSDSPDEFGESPYFVSIFGEPASREPWAWQIDSHHLCVNRTVIGDQMVLTPTFMGSEPYHVDERAAGRHRSERMVKKVCGLIDYATT